MNRVTFAYKGAVEWAIHSAVTTCETEVEFLESLFDECAHQGLDKVRILEFKPYYSEDEFRKGETE